MDNIVSADEVKEIMKSVLHGAGEEGLSQEEVFRRTENLVKWVENVRFDSALVSNLVKGKLSVKGNFDLPNAEGVIWSLRGPDAE